MLDALAKRMRDYIVCRPCSGGNCGSRAWFDGLSILLCERCQLLTDYDRLMNPPWRHCTIDRMDDYYSVRAATKETEIVI